MSKVKVRKVGLDWVAEDEHQAVWCADWFGAMEAAYGHIAMGHQQEES